MGELNCRTVSCEVHNQCSILHRLVYHFDNLRIGVACGSLNSLVSVPEYLLINEVRVFGFERLNHLTGILHVYVPVSVVAHETDSVLPRTLFLIIYISDEFVDYIGGCGQVFHRNTSNTYLRTFLQMVGTTAVFEQSVVFLADITVDHRPTVVRLVGKQQV